MPFVSSAQGPAAKLHIRALSTQARIGITVLIAILLVLVAYNGMHLFSQETLTIDTQQESTSQEAQDTGDAAPAQSSHNAALPATSSSAAGEASATQPSTPQTSTMAYVFVSGAVVSPGVYELPDTSRVAKAIEMAGGFSDDAATDAVNLARVVQDGEQIAVPRADEVAEGSTFLEQSGVVRSLPAESGTSSGLVNINTATAEQLESIPGVGPATAQKIIASREAEGPFASIEDIQRVSGIGAKKFENMRDAITI